MLRLTNVCKKVNSFHLKDISLELPGGYIMGLIGENGAGKTTLLSLLCGLYAMDAGTVTLDGIDMQTDEAGFKQELGVVLHEELFDARESLLANANHYGSFYRNYREEQFRACAQRFGLDVGRRYRKLSKGEKLKFAMAFALSHQPRLLLLDEPTANFDSEFRALFFQTLREFVADGEHSVILATHMASDIDRLADYILFLKKGQQLVYDNIEGIRADYRMVAGEAYKIKLLKERVIHMETSESSALGIMEKSRSDSVTAASRALVYHSRRGYDPALKVWEPTVEEFMYFMVKEDSAGTRSKR